MVRAFRYYGKKRGNRRTGSPAWGRSVEAALSVFFFTVGCFVLAWMIFSEVVPRWRVNNEFVETSCKVLDTSLPETQGEDGPKYTPKLLIEYDKIRTTAVFDIVNTGFDNRPDAQAVLNRFEIYSPEKNNLYPCWYDPADSYKVVLTRQYPRWLWLAFAVPISFIVIGTVGIIHIFLGWGKSAERRSAAARNGKDRDFLRIRGHGDRRYPFVPDGAYITNSPGTKLKYRLPISGSPGWTLFGTLAFCVLWNSVVAVFLGFVIHGHLSGKPNWFGTFFILVFLVIGIAAIIFFIRRLLIATGIGPTRLEISDHPLLPTARYQVFLTQSGRLDVNVLRLSLTCEESATYRQGTNMRRETREVFRRELYRREDFAIRSGITFETEVEFDVPGDAMHSFDAEHNEINWALVVEGEAANWPNYKRTFPVIVRPAAGEPN